MKFTRTFVGVSLVCAALAGCGGGDSNDSLVVSGVWRGAATAVQNTCPAGTFPQTVNFVHTVNQNEGAVTVTTNDGVTLLGNTVGAEGFSVDGSTGQSNCTLAEQLEYESIENDSDNTANVDLRINRTCPNGTSCSIAYSGTAARGPVTTNPTPTPGGTPVATPGVGTPAPVTGGCTDVLERTFAGDGGCGISTVTVDQVSQSGGSTVLLNPFGSNGATSFAVNSANSSTASSVRTDLTIAGDAGYSCSLTCSPPSTFTVSCFKEGGATCVEKF